MPRQEAIDKGWEPYKPKRGAGNPYSYKKDGVHTWKCGEFDIYKHFDEPSEYRSWWVVATLINGRYQAHRQYDTLADVLANEPNSRYTKKYYVDGPRDYNWGPDRILGKDVWVIRQRRYRGAGYKPRNDIMAVASNPQQLWDMWRSVSWDADEVDWLDCDELIDKGE